jgi:two-component system, OmpR family, KDP operon response regulator KdpE
MYIDSLIILWYFFAGVSKRSFLYPTIRPRQVHNLMVASFPAHVTPAFAPTPLTLPNIHVLIVEDDADCLALYYQALSRVGCRVGMATGGASALKQMRITPPDVVLLDLYLPDMDGFALCQQIRQTSRVPILIVSGRDDEATKVTLLLHGADDYLVKPVGLQELIARIVTVLRRVAPLLHSAPVEVGPLRIDRQARSVTRSGQAVPLAPSEWNVLMALAQTVGQVVTHDKLLNILWPGDPTDRSAALHTTIKSLRRKIDTPDYPSLIISVPRIGYRLGTER